MKKSAITSVMLVLGAAMVLAVGSAGWAMPPVSIELRTDKQFYAYDEPIGVEVEVCNASTEDIWINDEVLLRPYYLELRVLDPAGRLILAKPQAVGTESPDAPPLAWRKLSDGRVVQVAGCDVLPPGCQPVSRSEDIQQHYSLELPGWYSAQVKLSVMGFSDEQCNADEPAYVGVLKSDFSYFYVQGSPNGVLIKPNLWNQDWINMTDKEARSQRVAVLLKPVDDEPEEGYDPQSIQLSYKGSHLSPISVRASYSKLKAYFGAKQAVEILGPVEAGQWYWLMISGRYKNGRPFAKEQKIKVVQ